MPLPAENAEVLAHPAARPATLPLWTMTAAPLAALHPDRQEGRADVQLGEVVVPAQIDPAVHPSVLATALARKERVIVQREPAGFVVLGVLRTAPTPGIEEAEEYHVKAARLVLEASHEVSVTAGRTGMFVRAIGQVETLAETITSRAASVHKIIGRIIRLN
jgi:hypothetical protein